MAFNIAKSQSLIRALKDQLSKRLPAYTIIEVLGSAGDQLLISQHATPVAGEQNIAIRIKGQDTQFTDVIGLAQSVYTPMVCQVIEEGSTIAHVSVLQMAVRAALEAELGKLGVKQERWLNANTVVPALSQFAADGSVSTSTLEASIAPDIYWPLSGQ
jgi:hypothetical protein